MKKPYVREELPIFFILTVIGSIDMQRLTEPSPASTYKSKVSLIEREAAPNSKLKPTYNVVIKPGENGWIVVRCKELHVNTQGKTEKAAVKNAIEAINLVIDELNLDKEFNLNLQRMR